MSESQETLKKQNNVMTSFKKKKKKNITNLNGQFLHVKYFFYTSGELRSFALLKSEPSSL